MPPKKQKVMPSPLRACAISAQQSKGGCLCCWPAPHFFTKGAFGETERATNIRTILAKACLQPNMRHISFLWQEAPFTATRTMTAELGTSTSEKHLAHCPFQVEVLQKVCLIASWTEHDPQQLYLKMSLCSETHSGRSCTSGVQDAARNRNRRQVGSWHWFSQLFKRHGKHVQLE